MPVRIIVVRHGERLDESDRKQWHSIRTQETRNDPPLTSAGWEQAAEVARRIAARVLPKGGYPVTLYSSPTARTISTAAGIASKLGGLTIAPCYGLNCCAAAQASGVARGFPAGVPDKTITGDIELSCWPPIGDPKEVDHRQRTGGGFVETVKELACAHNDGDVLIMVTHREGIWSLHQHVGTRMTSGYCNTSFYSYDLMSRKLTSWDPAKQPLHTLAAVEDQVKDAQEAAMTAVALPGDGDLQTETLAGSLEAVLERGSGKVMIHRGGRDGDCTMLWQTLGVRGVWVGNSAVPNGELVTLLSSPLASEGNEGDFVFVQRSNGVQGWTKVKNVNLPRP